MKKCFCLLIILLIPVQDLSAQDNKNVRFGIRAGINYSHMDFSRGNTSEDKSINTNWQVGLAAGFVMIVPLTGKLYIQPEYLFSQQGGELKDKNIKYTIDYLSLPVFLRWEVNRSISLFLGPQFDLVIDSEREVESVASSLEHEIEHRSIGVTTGVEFRLSSAFFIGGKYLYGLNNIDISHSSMALEFKHEMLQFSLIYIINNSDKK